MDNPLTIDGTPVPVLVGTWRATPFQSGSRGFTERNVLRSVRSGNTRWEFQGTSMFHTREEADALFAILDAAGDHTVAGDLPGGTFTCECEPGDVVPIDHRPSGVTPDAKWQVSWRLIEVSGD